MSESKKTPVVIVGVDGSAPSIEELRQAVTLGAALGVEVQALTCWQFPAVYESPYSFDGVDHEKAAQKVLYGAVEKAFGIDWPENLTTRLVRGPVRETLIAESKDARLMVLGGAVLADSGICSSAPSVQHA